MDIILFILRIAHIFGGVFWVGSAIINEYYLLPSVKDTGPDGQKFMQTMMVKRRFPIAISISATLTILAGFLLYWRDSAGLQLSWITSSVGIGFTIGALAAVASYVLGATVFGPTGKEFGSITAAIQGQGGRPTPEQQAQIERLSRRMSTGGHLNTILLVIALLSMSTARYW
jgi:hypothetical protein